MNVGFSRIVFLLFKNQNIVTSCFINCDFLKIRKTSFKNNSKYCLKKRESLDVITHKQRESKIENIYVLIRLVLLQSF